MLNGSMFKPLIQDAFTFALEIQFKLDFDYMVVYKMIQELDFKIQFKLDFEHNVRTKSANDVDNGDHYR